MLKAEVYRSNNGSASFKDSFEANCVTTGTQKGRNGTPKIDGATHFVSSLSLRLLANSLVTYLKLMKDNARWKQFEDGLVITFPRDIKIFHPLDGASRILYPLSENEVRELWTQINYYSNREEVRYED